MAYTSPGQIVPIGQFGAAAGNWGAYGINDSGVIVGGISETGAFVNYTGQPGGQRQRAKLAAFGCQRGCTAGDAFGIDNNGDIAGLMWSDSGSNYAGYFLSPVPEPAGLALVGTGAIAILAAEGVNDIVSGNLLGASAMAILAASWRRCPVRHRN